MAAECDGVIQTVVQSLVGPLLSKKYVDCEILMGKGRKFKLSSCKELDKKRRLRSNVATF